MKKLDFWSCENVYLISAMFEGELLELPERGVPALVGGDGGGSVHANV